MNLENLTPKERELLAFEFKAGIRNKKTGDYYPQHAPKAEEEVEEVKKEEVKKAEAKKKK